MYGKHNNYSHQKTLISYKIIKFFNISPNKKGPGLF